jgi:hypothetical protein
MARIRGRRNVDYVLMDRFRAHEYCRIHGIPVPSMGYVGDNVTFPRSAFLHLSHIADWAEPVEPPPLSLLDPDDEDYDPAAEIILYDPDDPPPRDYRAEELAERTATPAPLGEPEEAEGGIDWPERSRTGRVPVAHPDRDPVPTAAPERPPQALPRLPLPPVLLSGTTALPPALGLPVTIPSGNVTAQPKVVVRLRTRVVREVAGEGASTRDQEHVAGAVPVVSTAPMPMDERTVIEPVGSTEELDGSPCIAGCSAEEPEATDPSNAGPTPEAVGPSVYAVGYKCPPLQSRFRPGQCGNPKGRPRKSRNSRTIAREQLDATMTVKVDGKTKKMSRREVMFQQLTKRAVEGADIKAMDYLRKVAGDHADADAGEGGGVEGAVAPLSAVERRVLLDIQRRRLAATGFNSEMIEAVLIALGLLDPPPGEEAA